MSILNLDKLFYPHSVAVVGASNREGTPGQVVMHNLLHGGFEGPIMPVSQADRAISGVLAYRSIDDLPITPDLAVLCAKPHATPEMIRTLGERGTRAAILLPDAPGTCTGNGRATLAGALRREAERFGLRLLGPDAQGVMVPGIGLNASIVHAAAQPGGVAFVSQSSTVCSAVLDWAREHDIGFSHFVSLGETADIGFGDIIDYLGNDQMTRAVLLYIESIANGRSFLSAGRGASRNKPILVIKSGRTAEGQLAAFGEHGADGTDDIYDAAIRRAGMLRVYGFTELFSAVETLARSRPLRGDRLAVISNGTGIAVMAVDALVLSGGRLATLSDATVTALAKLVPNGRSRANPVVFDDDAQPEHYGVATRALLSDPQVDAVIVVHAPEPAVSSTRAAEAVIRAQKELRGAVLCSWMGGPQVAEARRMFADANIPSYDTPNQAVDAFVHMMRYRRNQDMLIETPTSTPIEQASQTLAARTMVEEFLAAGRNFLGGREAKSLLAAYGIPLAEARIAANPDEAAAIAQTMGFPVVVRELPKAGPTTVGPSVQPFLDSPDEVRTAAESLLQRGGRRAIPGSQGLLIERMTRRPGAHEVMIRVTDDPVFGPVIIFGHGGAAAEVIADRAVALPPLNTSLARELLSRTRIYKLLKGYRDCPPADVEALCLTLVRISQMIVDLPELAALEINPLIVDAQGVYAVDAQVLIAESTQAGERRLAIRPYPKELEEEHTLPNGRTVMLRPIRPEDEPAHHELLSKCAPEDLRLRFFHLVRRLPHSEMARLTQIDYDREMAFIAAGPKEDGSGWETLGVVRTIADLANEKAEYAILVRSDMKGQRLGRKLMEKIISHCRSRGIGKVVGVVLPDNRKMLDLVYKLGFTGRRVPDDDMIEVELDLRTADAAPGTAPAARPEAKGTNGVAPAA